MQEISALPTVIDKLEEREEVFWRQRSRIKWLTDSDPNSWFCHQTTIQRRIFNKIEKLQDAHGGLAGGNWWGQRGYSRSFHWTFQIGGKQRLGFGS